MNLHPAQSQIAKDTHRFRVVNCGRRFGKTFLSVLEMVAKAIYGNDRNIVYIAPTYQQARDIAWQELKKVCQPIVNKVNESRLEIVVNTTKGGTSTIMLRGWESIETLRGQKFHFIVVDEIASMRNWWSNWQEVIRPTLTDYRGEALFISTPKGFNHFYDLYNLENTDTDYKSFHFTSYDNPHIPFDELEKAKKEVTEDRFAQEYIADFRKTEGLVYKEFNRQIHIYSDRNLEPMYPTDILAGIDWGWTNPASSHRFLKSPDRHYWITDEFYKSGKTTSEIIEYVKTYGASKVYPDPAEPDRNEEARRAGLNVREVSKEIEAGIACVKDLFKQGRIHIHSSCINLIQELETYSYPEKKPDKNESEVPIKENDHACFTKDAILDFPIGVSMGTKSNGLKDVYEFMGSKVTADHPYLTQRGFVRLDDLRYSDRIVIWKNKLWMELHLDGTQTQTGASLKTILYLLQRNVSAIKQNAYIGIYGRSLMVKFLKECRFIIKTVLQLIMTYLISNLFQLKNIILNITKKCCLNGELVLKKLVKKLSFGTNPKTQNFSIAELQNLAGKTKEKWCYDVISAGMSTPHISQIEASTATIIAKLKHLGKEEVFSTVSSLGFFTANGVVVSNCDEVRYVLYMQEGKATNSVAHVHYASNTQPRNNLNPVQTIQGMPPELKDKPRMAHTHYQNLRR